MSAAHAPAGERVLLDADALQRTLHRIAHEIIEGNDRLEQVALIGFYRLPLDWLDEFPIRVQGVTLAQVKSAFARRVVPSKLSIVVVGAPD